MGADVRKMSVVRDASEESLKCVPQRREILDNIITESICLDTAITNISLCLGRVHLESQFVAAMEEENFEMLDLGVGEQDDILAEVGFGLACGHIDVEGSVRDGLILELDFLEALALVGASRVGSADLGCEYRQKRKNGAGSAPGIAAFTGGHGDLSILISTGHLLFVELGMGLEECLLLSIVDMEGSEGRGDGLFNVSLGENCFLNKAAELVLLNLGACSDI